MKIPLYLFVLGVCFLGCDQVDPPSFPIMVIEEPTIDNGVVTFHGEVQLIGDVPITEWGFEVYGWGSTKYVVSEGKMSRGKYSVICPSTLTSGRVYRAWAYARTKDGKLVRSKNFNDFWAP